MEDVRGNSSVPDQEHRHGESYSNKNKIPTVQKFNEEERRKRKEAERDERISRKKNLARVVRDPVTGGLVEIKDSSGDHKAESSDMYITVPRRNLLSPEDDPDVHDSEFNSEGTRMSELRKNDSSQNSNLLGQFGYLLGRKSSRSSASVRSRPDTPDARSNRGRVHEDKQNQRRDKDRTNAHDEDGWVDLPMRGKRSNIMYYTLPDPDFDLHHDHVLQWFMRYPFFVVSCELFRYFVIDFGRLPAICLYLLAGYWLRQQIAMAWTAAKLDTVKRRGQQALAKRVPESVEWLNELVAAVWKQINPAIFAAAVDKLEDIMQASAPSVVHAVKVDDLGHGDHPVRLLSMRYLDKSEIKEDESNSTDDQSPGDFVNMEVSVAYSATKAGTWTAAKVKNMHLLIYFYSGLANVLAVPIPVWVEIEGFIATIRLRMQFTPEFPYIKNTTVSLMGLPTFNISVIPLSSNLANITNLPIISTFVEKSIKAACNQYVAPKSYSIDVGQIIAGDDIARDCIGIGVIVVHIHRAESLKSQDRNGLSDPYMMVSMSNYGKPLYSTRIVERTVNPIFQETCFILVTPEALRSKERLSLQLWSSDRLAADTENGRVEFDLQDLIRNGGGMETRHDSLVSSSEGRDVPGTLDWSVGYFSKRKPNIDLATDGSDAQIADDIKAHPDFKGRGNLPDRQDAKRNSFCPPDPDWPSGILNIEVHQAIDLYADEPKGSWKAKMHFRQGQDTTSPEIEEDEDKSPSAYCTIIVNDQLIYKTRTKPFSSRPYFNAGTERFIRDWRTAVCLVAVRDSRTREHDALLGVIPLKLSEVFKNASQVTKKYPLVGGVGEAKVRISMLWESIDYKISKHLLGWDVGNIRFTSKYLSVMDLKGDGRHIKNMKIKMYTTIGSHSIGGHDCHEHDSQFRWSVDSKTDSVELPITHRHASALCIEFHSKARKGAYAVAMLWLTDLIDNEVHTVTLPVWRTDNDERRYLIRQSRIENDDDLRDTQQIGSLAFEAVFLRGLGDSHGKQVRGDTNLRQVHECWQATIAHGHRLRGDAYLVGQNKKEDKSEGQLGSEPYNQLNSCAQNARSGDPQNTTLSSKQGEHVDEEGRQATTESSRWAVEEARDVDEMAQKPATQHYSGALHHTGSTRTHRESKIYESPESASSSTMSRADHSSQSISGLSDQASVIPSAKTNGNLSRSDSRMSMSTNKWNSAWVQQTNNLGDPIEESDNILTPQRTNQNRGSVLLSPPPLLNHSRSSSSSTITTSTTRSRTRRPSDNDHRSRLDQLRQQRTERDRLHREQRGVMQFKPMRTLKWMKDGVVMGSHKLSDSVKLKAKQPQIQTEV